MKMLSAFIFSVMFIGTAVVSGPALAQDAAEIGFEKMKTLAGEWDGVKPDGQKVGLSYEITAAGSAVVETLMPVNEPRMVTVYHMDGDRLMMTHYCSAGNQPRMEAELTGGDVKQIDFRLHDITNLTDSSPGHMEKLTLKFKDSGHLTQVWTFSQEGKSVPATFNFTRKR